MVELKWDIDEVESVKFIGYPTIKTQLENFWSVYGYGYTEHFSSFDNNGVMKWCLLVEELRKVGNKLIDDMINKDCLNKILNGFNIEWDQVFALAGEMDNLDISKLSDKEVFALFRKAYGIYSNSWNNGLTVEAVDMVLGDRFKKVLDKYELTTEEFSKLSEIPEQSFINERKKELMQIALNNDKDKLDIVRERYKWINTGHAGRDDYTYEQVLELFNDICKKDIDYASEIKKIDDFKQDVLDKKNDLIKKYDFNKDVLSILKIIDEWGPMHDKRKRLFMNIVYYVDTIIIEISKRLKIDLDDIHQYIGEEIIELENGTFVNKDEVEERKKAFIYYGKRINGEIEYTIKSGNDAEKFEEKLLGLSRIKETDVIEGKCGSSGNVKGIVKVVVKKDDMVKMNRGDILVSTMTRPELVPAMHKAGAIVTDEGGLTCHAAVVSREMGIPCLIGTIIGTRVLKDGDLVEVDADKGIVRKIQK